MTAPLAPSEALEGATAPSSFEDATAAHTVHDSAGSRDAERAAATDPANPCDDSSRLPDIPEVYDDLHRMAERRMKRQPLDHTLQATALVNEVYLRLFRKKRPPWRGRVHFFRVAAAAMHSVLCDCARRKIRRPQSIPADFEVMPDPREPSIDAVTLQDAIDHLGSFDPRAARIARLRLDEGQSVREVAAELGISTRHAHREWSAASAWLRNTLRDEDRAPASGTRGSCLE